MDASIQEIQDAVLAYLRSHPDAEDSLEGVAEWWILEHWLEVRTTQVREALDGLVERGWVVRQPGASGGVRYRLHPDRRGQDAALPADVATGGGA